MTVRSPVFVLGVPRSGTSSVQLALLSHGGYAGQGEGHVVPLLGKLLATADGYWDGSPASRVEGTTLQLLGKEGLRNAAREALRSLYQRRFDDRPFSDKTPGFQTIQLAPELQRIYPEARFVYCQRRGLDNVASKLRKFPGETFRVHCTEWADTVRAWRYAKKDLTNVLTVDQIELARAPRATARRLGDFLGLDQERVTALGDGLATRKVEVSAADPARLVSLDDFGWSEEQVAMFRKWCDEVMQLEGYRYDARYWERALPTDGAQTS